MNKKSVTFGVAGCGNIGRRHVHLLNTLESTNLAGIYEVVDSRGKEYSESYNCRLYDTYQQMLDDKSVQVVSICTPHGLHAEMSIQASEAGKHVLVEKPMALSVEDCNKMIDAARQNDVRLLVVKQNRFNVPIGLTREALVSGKLGKIYMVECNVMWNRNQEYYTDSNWRGKRDLEGGALYTQVSHFIDLLIWWFGNITKAHTHLSTRNHDIEIEDCGHSMLEFDSGVTGVLNWTTCVYNKNYEGSITIIGEKGTIKIGGRYLNKIEFWDVMSHPLPEDIEYVDKPNDYGSKYQGSSSNHDKLYQNVAAALLNERHHVIEGDEGIKTIEAIELIYGSKVNQ
ncbi:MAG: Gfo/Idh/MocA family oxidoreductase [Calditrichota bacterium]